MEICKPKTWNQWHHWPVKSRHCKIKQRYPAALCIYIFSLTLITFHVIMQALIIITIFSSSLSHII